MGLKLLGVVNLLKEYSALFVSCAAGICVLVGALFADAYFQLFDIDFYSSASFSDYVILGLNKLPLLLVAMLAILAAFGILYTLGNYPKNPRLFLNRFYKSKTSPVDKTHIHQGFLNTLRINVDTSSVIKNNWFLFPLAIGVVAYIGVIRIGSNGVYGRVTSGQEGVVSVLYGNKGESLNCLSPIGEVGGFQYYWSLYSSEVISINKGSIKVIRKTHEFMPYVSPPTRPHPRSEQAVKDAWSKNLEIVNTQNEALRKAFIKAHCTAITL